MRANNALPPELVNVPVLRVQARTLRRELARATCCRHVLAWSLEEAVDDLTEAANAAAERTVFPNAALEALLAALVARMDARDVDFALSGVHRRRACLKLLALSAFFGGRRIRRLRLRGVNDEFFVGPALLTAAQALAAATGKSLDLPRLADECEALLGSAAEGAGGIYFASLGIGSSLSVGRGITGSSGGSISSSADAAWAEDRALHDAYGCIASPFRDVAGEELPLLGAADVTEVAAAVLPDRLRAEVKRWLARCRRVAAAAATTASSAVTPSTPGGFASASGGWQQQQSQQ